MYLGQHCDTRFPRFPVRLLMHTQSGDQPGNNLAKFGYILYMKVEKK